MRIKNDEFSSYRIHFVGSGGNLRLNINSHTTMEDLVEKYSKSKYSESRNITYYNINKTLVDGHDAYEITAITEYKVSGKSGFAYSRYLIFMSDSCGYEFCFSSSLGYNSIDPSLDSTKMDYYFNSIKNSIKIK